MADVEQKIENLEGKYSDLHTVVNVLANKVDNILEELRERDKIRAEEMRDFKNEMRTQNLLRAKEISEIGKKLESAQEKHDEDMKAIAKKHEEDIKAINATTDTRISKIESNINSMTKHIQILSLTAMGGIIAAGVGIAAMIWSVINK